MNQLEQAKEAIRQGHDARGMFAKEETLAQVRAKMTRYEIAAIHAMEEKRCKECGSDKELLTRRINETRMCRHCWEKYLAKIAN